MLFFVIQKLFPTFSYNSKLHEINLKLNFSIRAIHKSHSPQKSIFTHPNPLFDGAQSFYPLPHIGSSCKSWIKIITVLKLQMQKKSKIATESATLRRSLHFRQCTKMILQHKIKCSIQVRTLWWIFESVTYSELFQSVQSNTNLLWYSRTSLRRTLFETD